MTGFRPAAAGTGSHEGRAKIGLDLDASAGLFRLKINRLLRAEAQEAAPAAE